MKQKQPQLLQETIRECYESGNYPKVDFMPFENAYARLTAKLRPIVFGLSFLKN